MAQWVKDPALSLQQLGLLLWHGFDPWPGNFRMPQVRPKKKSPKLEIHSGTKVSHKDINSILSYHE